MEKEKETERKLTEEEAKILTEFFWNYGVYPMAVDPNVALKIAKTVLKWFPQNNI